MSARARLPRSWSVAIAIATLATAVLFIASYPVMHVYTRHFLGAPPAIGIDWSQLTSGMTESDALRQFAGTMITCTTELREGSNNLGDRVCYTALKSVNDVPALTLALFFQRGRLAQAVVHVPWWAHHRASGMLVRKLGFPSAIEDSHRGGDRLVQWKLATGRVAFNRDPGWNPLGWSAVLWLPQ